MTVLGGPSSPRLCLGVNGSPKETEHQEKPRGLAKRRRDKAPSLETLFLLKSFQTSSSASEKEKFFAILISSSTLVNDICNVNIQ